MSTFTCSKCKRDIISSRPAPQYVCMSCEDEDEDTEVIPNVEALMREQYAQHIADES